MKIKKDQHQEIIEEYKSGKSLTQIAKDFQVSSSTVYYVLKKHNEQRRSRGAIKGRPNSSIAKIPADEIPKIIDRYKNTTDTLASIANDYKVTKQAIDELLKRNNINKREYVPKRIISDQADINEVIRLYENNISIKQISKDFKCSTNTIRKILLENNIETRGLVKVNKSEHSMITDRYLNGEFMEDIAKDYSVTAGTIGRILKQKGVKSRKLKKFTPHTYNKVYDCIDKNLTYKQISEKLNLKPATVAFIAKKKYEKVD